MPTRRAVVTAAAGLYRAVGRESNRCCGPERTQNGAVTAGVGRRRNISRILDRFFGQKLARRTTQKFGDLVDVIQIVLRAVFGTFHLPDVAVRECRKPALPETLFGPCALCVRLLSHSCRRLFSRWLVFECKTKKRATPNSASCISITYLCLSNPSGSRRGVKKTEVFPPLPYISLMPFPDADYGVCKAALSFFGREAATRSYDCFTRSSIVLSGTSLSKCTLIQCFLFIWYAGVTPS